MKITVHRSHLAGLKLAFTFIKIRVRYLPLKYQITFYFVSTILVMLMLTNIFNMVKKDVSAISKSIVSGIGK